MVLSWFLQEGCCNFNILTLSFHLASKSLVLPLSLSFHMLSILTANPVPMTGASASSTFEITQYKIPDMMNLIQRSSAASTTTVNVAEENFPACAAAATEAAPATAAATSTSSHGLLEIIIPSTQIQNDQKVSPHIRNWMNMTDKDINKPPGQQNNILISHPDSAVLVAAAIATGKGDEDFINIDITGTNNKRKRAAEWNQVDVRDYINWKRQRQFVPQGDDDDELTWAYINGFSNCYLMDKNNMFIEPYNNNNNKHNSSTSSNSLDVESGHLTSHRLHRIYPKSVAQHNLVRHKAKLIAAFSDQLEKLKVRMMELSSNTAARKLLWKEMHRLFQKRCSILLVTDVKH